MVMKFILAKISRYFHEVSLWAQRKLDNRCKHCGSANCFYHSFNNKTKLKGAK